MVRLDSHKLGAPLHVEAFEHPDLNDQRLWNELRQARSIRDEDLPKAMAPLNLRVIADSTEDRDRAAAEEWARSLRVVDGIVYAPATPEPRWVVRRGDKEIVVELVRSSYSNTIGMFRGDRKREAVEMAKHYATLHGVSLEVDPTEDLGLLDWTFEDVLNDVRSWLHMTIYRLQHDEVRSGLIYLPREAMQMIPAIVGGSESSFADQASSLPELCEMVHAFRQAIANVDHRARKLQQSLLETSAHIAWRLENVDGFPSSEVAEFASMPSLL